MRPDHDEWCGDVWKSFVKFRATRPDLQMRTVDCDWGCGIIRRGEQDYPIQLSPDISILEDRNAYAVFCLNKSYWMNTITENQFKQMYL